MSKHIENMDLSIKDGKIHGSIDHETFGKQNLETGIFTKFITYDSRLCILSDQIDVRTLFNLGVSRNDAYDTIDGSFVFNDVIELILSLLSKLVENETCGITEYAIAEALGKKYGKEYEIAYLCLWITSKGCIRNIYLEEHTKRNFNEITFDDKGVEFNGSNSSESVGHSED